MRHILTKPLHLLSVTYTAEVTSVYFISYEVTLVHFVTTNPSSSHPTPLPLIPSTQHKYIFANYARDSVHASPPQGIVKVDVIAGTETSWIGGADQYLSEPIFAKKSNAGNLI
jgi:hypothetical protein